MVCFYVLVVRNPFQSSLVIDQEQGVLVLQVLFYFSQTVTGLFTFYTVIRHIKYPTPHIQYTIHKQFPFFSFPTTKSPTPFQNAITTTIITWNTGPKYLFDYRLAFAMRWNSCLQCLAIKFKAEFIKKNVTEYSVNWMLNISDKSDSNQSQKHNLRYIPKLIKLNM